MAMSDNRKVKDRHQEGISRVKQRPGDMEKGQSAKMGEGHKSSKRGRKHEMHEKREKY